MRCLCSLALGLSGFSAFGQMNTGEISGSVQDLSGSVLPGATVVAQQGQTLQRFTTVSNNAGEYLFAQVPLGVYTLTVSATDFKQTVVVGLEVHAGDRLRKNVTLPLGERIDVVTIEVESGGAPLASAEIRDV